MIQILTPVSCAAVMGVESARAFAMSTRLPAVLPIDSVMLLPAQSPRRTTVRRRWATNQGMRKHNGLLAIAGALPFQRTV